MINIPLFVKAKKKDTHLSPRPPVFRRNYDFNEQIWNTMLDEYRDGKIKGVHDFMKKKRKEPSPIKMWQERRKKRKKKAEASVPLMKVAIQVIVEPAEPLVDEAIKLLNEKSPGLLDQAGVTKVVLESGDPGHFGKVKSDQLGVIYVSLDKIKSFLSGKGDKEDVVRQISETLAHEAGHLKSKFQGGEAPAEAEEQLFRSKMVSQ